MALVAIAEKFYSVQGEGVWSGTPMLFLRLAGCPVGKYVDIGNDELVKLKRRASPRYSICTTVDGQTFLCDTDYHSFGKMELEDVVGILKTADCQHVCITGGEPMAYPDVLTRIFSEVTDRKIHIETSGTVPIIKPDGIWITCSPKWGFLEANRPLVDEWKFLIKAGLNDVEVDAFVTAVDDAVGDSQAPVFIQAVNDIKTIDKDSMDRAYSLVMCRAQYSNWRVGIQLHKILKVR